MTTLVVLFDKVNYTAKPAWQGGKPEQVTYRKGDEVDAESFADSVLGPDQELNRLLKLGAIGSPAVLALHTAAATAAPAIPSEGMVAYDDAELGRMKVEELAAIVNQHPDQADRIVRMEALKGAKARRGVLALHPDYRDELKELDTEAAFATLVGAGELSGDDGATSGEAAPHGA